MPQRNLFIGKMRNASALLATDGYASLLRCRLFLG
jgi:hypothetical protein